MKAIIKLDVPEWQIGQDVSVYFPDTMWIDGRCETDNECENCAAAIEDRVKVVRCKDCFYSKDYSYIHSQQPFKCIYDNKFHEFHDADWFCANGKTR